MSPDLPPLRVLIVEDGPVSRQVLEGYVERHSGLALAASVGTLPEAAAALDGVDLVLLDIELGEASGFALARRLEVPFIVVTATETHAIESVRLRAADVLFKPVGFRRFAEAVERARRLARL